MWSLGESLRVPDKPPPMNDPGPEGHEPDVNAVPRLTLAVATGAPASGPDPDLALVLLAQAGDRAAFAELFRRHHARVRAMCARMLGASASGHAADIDDAVQTAFLEAWRSLHRFEGRARFTTWITRVAIHTCFSTRRRLARLFAVAEPDAAARPVWGQEARTADAVTEDRRQEAALASVLKQLSEKKRAVFVLADLEGMSSTEIAEVLGIPDATVRTRLFHARREVAVLLRAHPAFAALFADREGGGR